ncbi:hypothetical protein [Nonomuraea cavernae]|uniref:Uncharacterized protein n=1 Tax=Nonomuraea cavernae TaxID=2045107 RepID=A0A917YU34_9ACTN|nr:hypothetical protein [Nonomuraea cavernae]MCA2190800.1 hypothetical protein [Nonomuraea cavernae]GGO67030.1 hypothetical protein GCM10012289_22540 [Nonomuraea cavernae]
MAGPEGAMWNPDSLNKGSKAIEGIAGAVSELIITNDRIYDRRAPRPSDQRDPIPHHYKLFYADGLAVEVNAAAKAVLDALRNLRSQVTWGSDGLARMAKKETAVEDHNLAAAYGKLEKKLDRPEGETS